MSRLEIAHPGLLLFEELLGIPAPSGFEQRMIQFLSQRLDDMGFSPEVDSAGNLLVRLASEDPKAPLCCIAAHVDEIGMVVTRIEEDGSLRVDRSGGLLPWKVGETPVEILGDHETITGVVSFGSGHSRSVIEQQPSWRSVRVLTGLSVDRLSAKGIRQGSPMVPARDVRGPFLFGDSDDPWVAAWSFDNRLSVVVLLQVLQRLRSAGLSPKCPTIIAFTVQEEIGCHGAKVLAQRERPEIFIAVDGSPLVAESPIKLDGRPGIRSKDRVATYDQSLLHELCRVSVEAGVELQPVVYDGAASDASLVFSIGASPRVACLGYVRESSHGFEVAPLATFDQLATTVFALVTELTGEG